MNEEFKRIWLEANEEAKKFAYKEAGEDVMIYPCGFAWVIIRPANHPFAKWIVQNGFGRHEKDYYKGVMIWVGQYNQSYLHKYAHASKLANILQLNNIPASCGGRLD